MTPITMTRRTFGGLSALLLAGLAGCGRENPGSGGSSEVTYQLSWTHSVQFGGTYIAQDRGLFEDLTVRLAAGGPNVAGDANTVSGAAWEVDRFKVQNASFHARIRFSRRVEAMPGMAIGVST